MLRILLITLLFTLFCAPGWSASFTLSNGDVVSGDVLEENDSRVVVMHEVFGRIEIPKERIQVDPPPPAPRGIFGSNLLVGWKRSLAFGMTGAEGNSDTLDVNAGLNLNYEDDARRWIIGAGYLRSDADGDNTKNQSFVQATRDWLFPGSPWFAFGTAKYERDSFEIWEQRYSIGGGPGYQFLDNDTWNVRGRTGLQLTRTSGRGSEHDLVPEWMIGMEALWNFTEGQSLSLFNSTFPSLDEAGEYRNLTGVTWTAALEGIESWRVQVGFQNEYDSMSESPTDKNDFRYFANMLYDF